MCSIRSSNVQSVTALIDIPELIEQLQKNYIWWKDQEETMAKELEKRQSKNDEKDESQS